MAAAFQSQESLGEVYALLAALNWAFAVVLFKRCGERIAPLSLNVFKNVVGIVLLFATLLVAGSRLDDLSGFRWEEIAILALSGVLGIAIADTFFFHALNLCGVGIISIVDCTYSLFAIMFSWLLLSEKLTASHYLGAALILTGVLLATRHAPPTDRTRRQIVAGVLYGMFAMCCMAFAIVYAKPVLTVSRFPLIWATTIRMLAGTIALVIIGAASPRRARLFACFRPSPDWKVSIPASVLGAYLSMIFWVGGFKHAQASIAAVLNQTSIIFAIILASLMLKEQFTLRKLIAVSLAFLGVALVAFDGLTQIRRWF